MTCTTAGEWGKREGGGRFINCFWLLLACLHIAWLLAAMSPHLVLLLLLLWAAGHRKEQQTCGLIVQRGCSAGTSE